VLDSVTLDKPHFLAQRGIRALRHAKPRYFNGGSSPSEALTDSPCAYGLHQPGMELRLTKQTNYCCGWTMAFTESATREARVSASSVRSSGK